MWGASKDSIIYIYILYAYMYISINIYLFKLEIRLCMFVNKFIKIIFKEIGRSILFFFLFLLQNEAVFLN